MQKRAAVTAFWSGLALVLGGCGALLLGVFATTHKIDRAGEIIAAGLFSLTNGIGILAASRTGGFPEATEKTPAPQKDATP